MTVAIILVAPALEALALAWKVEFMKPLLTATGPVFLIENAGAVAPPRNILTFPFLVTGAAIGMKWFFGATMADLLLRAAYFMEGPATDMVTLVLGVNP